ncbi:MAG: hypothetical protein A2W61_07005 [Deltaproteobacteria bacterium RIFCSPLOWO2_01_44_7]|nr:MAG: hypothetical protein A2712_08255 [Deltaproteobacteria bacterium RIFCSPHIGHO2_01_FULL_43_49]OGQ14670.1 MAG: hypothetical protein A3D22_08745 [Deltaproteobacteria bacterium RIFCSPHIGHO2_02_FULL_44_53]OGQ28056.1 MAG: hypothetical protein A3D98_07455 [Deltaproteobacteria bacterium RIFCSPHIGHO2_12_FULL_44_21]OGQ31268.1 MAG: hypothetical protein A2979_07505 [Deltaproteobacteria bacterium RIFCSPLOWO2_01_FULL_45_74]OGQ43260.1 MAG: hypothetical protein A3I70_01165 [Deltaproteobacteria bacterium 
MSASYSKKNWMQFLKPFVKRFIGGESLKEALATLQNLKKEGFKTTLDYLGESVTNRDQALEATQEYIRNLRELNPLGLDKNISIKLTQIGLDIDEGFAKQNLIEIVKTAKTMNGFVRVDMEGSAYTEASLRLVSQAHQEIPCIGAVLQTMLRRTAQDVLLLIKKGVRIRLVKGAYKEPISIAFQDKRDVDAQYVTIMKRLLTSGIYHAIATHDEKIINEAETFVGKMGLKKDSFEFQMLLGIRADLARQLVKEGWNVRIYVPYGKAWFPYFMRRLRERRENVWFVIKNLFRGS